MSDGTAYPSATDSSVLTTNPPSPKDEGPRSAQVAGRSIVFTSAYLVLATAMALYAIIKLWPHPTPSGLPAITPPITSTAVAATGTRGGGSAKDTTLALIAKPTPAEVVVRQDSLCDKTDSACRICVAHEMQLQYESQRRNDPQCTYIFGHYFLIWQEERLLLLVFLAGTVGALLHSTRSLVAHVGNRNYVESWTVFYYLSPFVGSAIAFVAYIAIRGGFFSSTGTTADANPFMFVALGAFAGLFSHQVLEKLRNIAETAFEKAPSGKNSLPDSTVTPPADKASDVIDSAQATGKVDVTHRDAIRPRTDSITTTQSQEVRLFDIHAPGLTRVSIFVFFPKDVDNPDETLENNPFGLQGVNRFLLIGGGDDEPLPFPDVPPGRPLVSPQTLAFQAVIELLSNPTAEEEEQGFYPLDTADLGVSRVKIDDGIAQVVFFSNGGFKHFAGDLARELFKQAVVRTVSRIPTVKDVFISINL